MNCARKGTKPGSFDATPVAPTAPVLRVSCCSVSAQPSKFGNGETGSPIPHSLEIIQDCYAIYRRIEEELNLTHVAAHVGTEGNELADRMAMLGAQRKETTLRRYQEKIDIPTLLKMRAG